MEARKLPAAPALYKVQVSETVPTGTITAGDIHNKVNRTKLLNTALGGSLKIIEFTNIDCANADYFGARSDGGHVSGSGFSLFNIATDDAGICAEVNQSAYLGAADSTGATSAENDLVI